MKKTLAALAVLSAFAGSAIAADVTLYGRIDMGLSYTNQDADVAHEDDVNSFEMSSGTYTGNRFGLKGTEELGNGAKVGFVLENGFNGDDGTLNADGSIFDREATLKLITNYGEIGLGRVGILALDAGSYGIGGGFTPFGTGWGDVGNQHLLWGAGYSSRFSNMLTLATPEMAGFKVYAQYSFGDGSGDENKSSSNRYYGIGATYNNGGLSLAAVVDSINKKSNPELEVDGKDMAIPGVDVKDTVRVIIGGSYDFGFVKPYLSAAYFKDGNISTLGDIYDRDVNSGLHNSAVPEGTGKINVADAMSFMYFDGYAIALGADVPAFGGKFHGMVGYLDADSDRSAMGDHNDVFNEFGTIDFTRWMVGVGYDYNLSKRTVVYAGGGYMKDSWEFSGNADAFKDNDPSMFQFNIGMAHYF